jgi:hypothetical protein
MGQEICLITSREQNEDRKATSDLVEARRGNREQADEDKQRASRGEQAERASREGKQMVS